MVYKTDNVVIGFDLSSSKDHTVVSALNKSEMKIGDIIEVDSTWTNIKSLFGKYVVINIYFMDTIPMVNLQKID